MNSFLQLRWRSTIWYIVAISAVMMVATAILSYEVGILYRADSLADLVALAERVAREPSLLDVWDADDESVSQFLLQAKEIAGADFMALRPDGAVIAATSGDGRPQSWVGDADLEAILHGNLAVDLRDRPGGEPLLLVGVPVGKGETAVGALLIASPAAKTSAAAARMRTILLVVLGLCTLAVIAILLIRAERTSRGLAKLTEMAERITQGDLGARVLSLRSGQLGRLAASLNQMADRLQTQSRKRQRERDRLNTVMSIMTDGIVILNRRGEVRMMNPAAARVLNVSERKARRRSFVQVSKDHRIAGIWTACHNTGVEQSALIDLSNDASVHVVITPFLKRRARGYLVMIQDLTRLRQLETVRQDFVSNVSHELRTPLASLKALVETLRDGALDDPPAATRFLDRMEVELDALTQMVQELLELTRIESGGAPLQLEPVSLYTPVVTAAERLRPQAERGGVDLIVDVDKSLPMVRADSERIQQVVTNLVHNAIKFTPSGGSVVVRSNAGKSHVHVTVRDTGIGIAREDLQRVFERFYKSDRSRTYAGTGLGLSIASHVVQAHGGEIWADSVEGEWSLFGFSLPIAEDPSDAPAETDAPIEVDDSENEHLEAASAQDDLNISS